ncbi:MAG: hypothetical protein FWG77_06620 [Treponema sp.]|nr:hypothetical protein [Treponema sp.]
MTYNNGNSVKSKKMSRELLAGAHARLDDLIKFLEPYLLSLYMPGRRNKEKSETAIMEFLELSHEMAEGNPEWFPIFSKRASYEEKFFLNRELYLLLEKMEILHAAIHDMKTLFGSDVMESSMIFYNNVKTAARRDLPGARAIYDELKAVFPTKKK